ncbi:MAG: peptidoglycan-binding domain-containing protein, partial [Stellaceae bacterium]
MARPTVLIRLAAGAFVALLAALVPAAAGAPTVATATSAKATAGNAAVAQGNRVAATPALVRQVQFLLSSIGIDPGPIDGVPRQLTNAAVHKFEQQAGLPLADLVSSGQISTALLDRLRKAAAGVLLGTPQPPAASAPSSA